MMAVLSCREARRARPLLLADEKLAGSVGFYTQDGVKVASAGVGKYPHEIALSPDGRLAYVTDNGMLWMTDPGEGGNTVSVIDIAGRRRVAVIDLGQYRRPHGIDVDPRSGRLFVTVENPDGLVAIDPAARKVLRYYSTQGRSPHMVRLDASGEWAYVSNSATNTLAAVRVETGEVTLIPVDGRPQGAALSRDGRLLYLANTDGNSIAIIDTQTRTRAATIATGGGPARIAVTPDGGELVYNLQKDNAVGIADAASRKQVAVIPLPGQPLSLSLSSDGQAAYAGVQSMDKICVVSVKGRAVARIFDTTRGAGPDSVREVRGQ